MRVRFAVGPLTPYVLGSVGIHVVAAIATVWWGAWERPEPLAPSVVVDLVGTDPLALETVSPPPAPRQAVEQTPPPVESPPEDEPAAVPEDPEPVTTPKQKAPAEPKPKPTPTPPAPTEQPAGSGTAETAFKQGESGSAVGVKGLEDSDFDWYTGRLLNALYLSWNKPFLTGFVEPLDAEVGFTVDAGGRVTNIRIVSTSGERSLDRSAMRAVADATLPPFPPMLRKSPPKDVSVIFRLRPE